MSHSKVQIYKKNGYMPAKNKFYGLHTPYVKKLVLQGMNLLEYFVSLQIGL